MIMYFFAGGHLILALLLFAVTYAFLCYVRGENTLRAGLYELYDRINSLSGSREEVGRRLKALYGNMVTRGFITHVAENLEYSGAAGRFDRVTPELYIAAMIVLSSAMFGVGSVLSGRWYVGIIFSVLPWLVCEYVFARARDYRYRREEQELLAFVNCVESCAAQSDDIIYILEKSASMIEGPLSDELLHTVSKVKSGIRGTVALKELENRVEHAFFKTLIRNLEISSRNNANYREITAQCRSLLTEQLDSSKRLEGIYREAEIRLGMILVCAFICLEIMSQAILDMRLSDMFVMFSEDIIGSLLIVVISVVLMVTVYFAFISGKRGRR